jgi:hypothetical protein
MDTSDAYLFFTGVFLFLPTIIGIIVALISGPPWTDNSGFISSGFISVLSWVLLFVANLAWWLVLFLVHKHKD